jgi:squalene synthase HpnC
MTPPKGKDDLVQLNTIQAGKDILRLKDKRIDFNAPWTLGHPAFLRRRWSLAAANRYCLQLAKSHYENFPVMLSLFTKEQRQALAAIYAFARSADDFADEAFFEGFREQLLAEWESQLLDCQKSTANHPVFVALAEAMRRFDLPCELFCDLLDAFGQDCHKHRFADYEELLDYCRRSANPVGRLVLRVLGIDHADNRYWSDRICTALQLTNHWQDLSVDLANDRIYIPREDLDRFRISEWALLSKTVPRSFADLVLFEVNRTRELFREGWPLVVRSGLPANLYFASVWLGGRAVLRLVKQERHTILYRRPALNARTFTLTLMGAGLDRVPIISK